MNDPITVTEVVGRAVQGMTRPFFCKAGFFDYYVKGVYAGLDSLCCEWAGNIEHRTSNIERRSEEKRSLAEAVWRLNPKLPESAVGEVVHVVTKPEPLMCRPFRAWNSMDDGTQGAALGCHVMPRWGGRNGQMQKSGARRRMRS